MLPRPNIPHIHDRSGEPSHAQYDGLLFHDRRRSQSAEMNEMQQYLLRRMDDVSGAVFANGDVTEGGTPILLTGVPNKNIRISAGKVFVKGKFYSFDTIDLEIPLDAQVAVGVRLFVEVVDSDDDISLLGPAQGTMSYGQQGALRVRSWITWGWKSGDDGDSEEGDFFPVYSVDNGVIITENANPMVEIVYRALRRYDYDGNGNFVVRGLRVQFIPGEEEDENYQFQLEAGSAHILGDIVERGSDTRLTYPKDPDEATAENEYSTFTPGGDGKMNIVIARPPISEVTEIVGQKEKTIAVVRGLDAGGSDVIDPDISSIVSIVSVNQSSTVFAASTDFVRVGDELSWAPGGDEPIGGTTYFVTFRYIDNDGVADEVGIDFIKVSGYVPATDIMVSYTYRLPRIDLIVLKHDGTVARLKGVPALNNPAVPIAAPDQIPLATVRYNWFAPPAIRNIAVRAVHMSDLENMRSNIFELYRLHAQEKLRNDANQTDPAPKIGVFVDGFLDDTQRDIGSAQNAAAFDGFLMLPIEADAVNPDGAANLLHQLLPYVPVVEIAQTKATQCGLINQFQLVSPLEGQLRLDPFKDHWSLYQSEYQSQLTQLIVRSGLANRLGATEQRRELRDQQFLSQQLPGIELVDNSTMDQEMTETTTKGIECRRINVTAYVTGFLPTEEVVEAMFDGVNLPELVGLEMDLDGKGSAVFQIPPKIPTGVKAVHVVGNFNSYAETVFTASFKVLPDPPPPPRYVHHDPLAQTFRPQTDFQICGFDFQICKKGPTLAPILVQLRNVVNGYPGPVAQAQTQINVNNMTVIDANTTTQTLLANAGLVKATPNTVVSGNDIDIVMGSIPSRAVMKFDLPTGFVANTTRVFSARLTVMTAGHTARFDIRAHRLTQSFNGEQATWNSRQTGETWTAPGGTFVTENSDGICKVPLSPSTEMAFDVTNIVTQWAGGQTNNGIILKAVDETTVVWNQKVELDWTTRVPRLEIVYRQITGPGGDGWTRAVFDVPQFVRAGQEYAMVLLTTDPRHSVSFARLGDVMPPAMNDGVTGLVTQQPYPGGLLFESSNNTAWTTRQADDLTFRILRASYTATSRVVDLGKVEGEDVTDLMPRGLIALYSGSTSVDFDIEKPDETIVRLQNCQNLPLSARTTGDFKVKANLRGTNYLSPILYSPTVMILGEQSDTGVYIGRWVKADVTFKARVILLAYLPPGTSLLVQVASAIYDTGVRRVISGVHQYEWKTLTLDVSDADDNGFVENIYMYDGAKGVDLTNRSQVKITLTGSPAARLLVKDLQFYTKA